MHRYVIYFNPQGTRGYSRWMNYATKNDRDFVYDGERRAWFTNEKSHADVAKSCGMLVAVVEEVLI